MGGKQLFWHLTVVALELAVLLFLIDVNSAFACQWCATPPVAQPVLPAAIWRPLIELLTGRPPLEDWCSFPRTGLVGPIVAMGAIFVGHAIVLLHRASGDRS